MKKRLTVLTVLLLSLTFLSCSLIKIEYETPSGSAAGDKGKTASSILIPQVNAERMIVPQQLARSLINLKDAMLKYTPVSAKMDGNIYLSNEKLLTYPFVCFIADRSFDSTQQERENIRNYLMNGGFLLLENAEASKENSQAENALRKLMSDSLGSSGRFQIIPNTHEIYHSMFDFDMPPTGTDIGAVTRGTTTIIREQEKYLEGIFIDGRLACVLSNKGYSVKWNEIGNNEPQLKMGVNMIMYALQTQKK